MQGRIFASPVGALFKNVRHGAIVIAHPDDEVLWCGGLVLRYPARWSIICCTIPRTDPIRAWKFYDACASLGVMRARVFPFIEPDPREPLRNIDLDLSAYELIVTHNAAGEYGHIHHRSLHRFIADRYPDKTVTFGYGAEGTEVERIVLSEEEKRRKRAALACYDHTSPMDGKPKSEALLARYGAMYDLDVETYLALA